MSEPVIPERYKSDYEECDQTCFVCSMIREVGTAEAKVAEQAATIANLEHLLRDENDPFIAAIGPCQKELIPRCRCVKCRRERITAALSKQVQPKEDQSNG